MRCKALILTCTVAFMPPVVAQKVGIVLSGGGAKGLAHIGVLKALEEHNIPIDYITGTSMGGIVAGCYAAGISPYQLEDIVLSGNFLNWIRGKSSSNNTYSYGQRDRDPSFTRFPLLLNPKFALSVNVLNSSLAADWAINFALAETVASAESICRSNFDSLFVPLRIVGADVFTQQEIVLDSGVLSDALRVTQTVPLFYRPIKVNNKYLFDGGLYNNFPVDVMQKNFNPDLIIGSNVSTQIYSEYPYDKAEDLMSKTLPFILLNKSEPSKLPEDDIYIQPNLKSYTVFDFQKAKSLIDSGYVETVRQIEHIKAKINTERSCEAVTEARNAFNNRARPLLFDSILFKGFRKGQQRYLSKFFRKKKAALFSFTEIKSGYYKLMSEVYFRHIYPNIMYDATTRHFNFKLTDRPKTNLELAFGGAIANRNVSTIFLGLHHFYFGDIFMHSNLDIYLGDFHKSVAARLRLYIPLLNQVYFEPQFVFNSWHFLQDKGLALGGRRSLTILNSMDYRAGLDMTILLGKRYKASLYGRYVNTHDEYVNDETLVSTDTVDNLNLEGSRLGIRCAVNTLNRKQYASIGRHFRFSADWFFLQETFYPGSTSIETQIRQSDRSWLRIRAIMEQYFKVSKIYNIGYYLDGVLSNQPMFSNYQGSLINAPAFNPMQDSRSLLLRNFRAFNYVAVGLRNIISIYKNVDFRLEGYVFKPFEAILQGTKQNGILENLFRGEGISRFFFATTAGLVYHSTIGPISLSANYYEDAYNDTQNQFGIMFHVGFLLFNEAALE